MRIPNFTTWINYDESQLAFINWLIMWVNNPENKNLSKSAKYLIDYFTDNKIKEVNNLSVILAADRKETIFKINETNVLLIASGEVSLLDLENILGKTSYNYPGFNIIPIYVNTKHRVDFKSISKLGYKLFVIKDMLKVLKYGINLGIKNDIFLDYYTIIKNQYESNQSYNKYPVKNWFSNSYTGFYSKLQEELDCGNWKYYKDENYYGFVLPKKKIKFLDIDFQYYLQLKYNKLRIKLDIIGEDSIDKKMHCFTYLTNATTELFSIELNTDVESGEVITIATLNEAYIIKKENGFIDFEKTLENIKRIETYVDELILEAVNNYQK
jgi:hypothetical protein